MNTVNLELSKQLKENGYPQLKSDFHWVVTFIQPYHLSYTMSNPRLLPEHNNHCASPTADEILDQLPDNINGCFMDIWKEGAKWIFIYECSNGESLVTNETNAVCEGDSLADACAKMWIYLKINNLLEGWDSK